MAAVENGSERKATLIGKPSKHLIDTVLDHESQRDNNKFLVIGDRLNTDIIFGKQNSFQTLFVETGVHKLENVNEVIRNLKNKKCEKDLENLIPDFYISELSSLFER